MAPKYGRGLGNEIIDAINKGKLKEPISAQDVKNHMNSNGWYPPENYLNVFLANSSSPDHSKNFKKIFKRVDEGKYVLTRIR